MSWSVVICTRDRAALLAETLASLRALADPGVPYEVVVVDNGSTDGTRAVVEAHAAASRVPVRYVYEPRGGLSAARNAGVAAARGEAIAFTDDDVVVDPGWLAAFARALATHPVDFLGGRVVPRWGAPRPPWLPAGRTRGEIWGALALLDYGDRERPLAKPLGANMAFRAAALRAAGGFREDLGRDAASLKGQEVPELLQRLAAAGGRGGWYVPDAVVHHWVPAERLTKRYFRRWFYWKGVSRALVRDRVFVDGVWLPAAQVRRLAGLPRGLYKDALRAAGRLLVRAAAGDRAGAFEAETRLWYAAGYARA
ncbi:MAG TPA: glycosyltransferase, partial [Thermodesulfobacteriota bacterium]|nr:glycosyltransferase [Thermodesulfobacteriota bacterium]